MNELRASIEHIDNNKTEWAKIVSKPWQTPEQQLQSESEMREYLSFMDNILNSKSFPIKMAPSGTFTESYSEWFNRLFRVKKHYISNKVYSISRKIKIYLAHFIKH